MITTEERLSRIENELTHVATKRRYPEAEGVVSHGGLQCRRCGRDHYLDGQGLGSIGRHHEEETRPPRDEPDCEHYSSHRRRDCGGDLPRRRWSA